MTGPVETLLGSEMNDSEIATLLTEQGVGVLSLRADGVPYGVPLSFGYDGADRLYFLFVGHSEQLKKETYAETSEVASFVTFDIDPDGSWRSVMVTGSLERITPEQWETAREALTDNAFESELFAGDTIESHPNVWALEIDEQSGRAVGQR